MNVKLTITITEDYLLQVKYIDTQNKETIVQLEKSHLNTFHKPCIEFKGNFISVCNNSENAIHFMKQWFEQPNQVQSILEILNIF